ncbi:MAG: glutamine amidotransferase [Pirellulales bacterium]
MIGSSLVWGSPAWGLTALALFGVGALALVWGYWRAPASPLVTGVAASLKAIGLTALALCLIEPLLSDTRARRGANIFAIAADNSRSMSIHDADAAASRGENLQELLQTKSAWQERLSEDFDARRFVFDSHLRSVEDFSSMPLDGDRSALVATLGAVARRFHNLPLAGVLLFSDGNSTDAGDVPWDELPPIYPVVVGKDNVAPDISVTRVSVSQTNFESAPVVVRADIDASGFAKQKIVAKLFDADNQELQSETVERGENGAPLAVRFQLRPDAAGVSFYRVRAIVENGNPDAGPQAADAKSETVSDPAAAATSSEATLVNNDRIVVVDRGGGPYRVLYVCGRPNWDFKYLRRALDADDQLELVGLVRIARREPKFAFRGGFDQEQNLLFKNFDNTDADDVERYDQPVLLRLGTEDEHELRDGFPKTADQMYRYDAVILEDVEAGFFTEDQLALLQKFVNRRGGGLLMLGGLESFAGGKYTRTPIAAMLPVYLDHEPSTHAEHEYRLALTRFGWLQPWVRLRNTEPEERRRLATMSTFRSRSEVGHLKPLATVLAEVVDETGAAHPALVTQRYGAGRAAALTLSDLWRWGMKRLDPNEDDLEKSWRQTVRWLVADVPRRVEVDVEPQPGSETGAVRMLVRVRDPEYLPLDNAQVAIEVTTPGGKTLAIAAEPNEGEAGTYVAKHVPREPGAYRAAIKVAAADGSEVGQREAGWVAQPVADEFSRLRPNRAWLEQIAAKTGGEVVAIDDLNEFAAGLASRKVPITEPWVRPLWHHPMFYLCVIGCFAAEWGLRRWKGLA